MLIIVDKAGRVGGYVSRETSPANGWNQGCFANKNGVSPPLHRLSGLSVKLRLFFSYHAYSKGVLSPSGHVLYVVSVGTGLEVAIFECYAVTTYSSPNYAGDSFILSLLVAKKGTADS